jgi:hypothetical protein
MHKLMCFEPLIPASWHELMVHLGLVARVGRNRAITQKDFPTLYDVASVRLEMSPGGRFGARRVANPDALPRAYLVEDWVVASQETAFARIRDGDFDFQSRVMLEKAPPAAGWKPPADPPRARPATIERYEPESISIWATAPRPALLVLTDAFYPGWVARIDGEPTEILRANGVFRAVVLPPGEHAVTFSYEPASFTHGLAVSAASLALWLGVSLGVPLLRRRPTGAPSGDPPVGEAKRDTGRAASHEAGRYPLP